MWTRLPNPDDEPSFLSRPDREVSTGLWLPVNPNQWSVPATPGPEDLPHTQSTNQGMMVNPESDPTVSPDD